MGKHSLQSLSLGGVKGFKVDVLSRENGIILRLVTVVPVTIQVRSVWIDDTHLGDAEFDESTMAALAPSFSMTPITATTVSLPTPVFSMSAR
jgi:hypothetical protein